MRQNRAISQNRGALKYISESLPFSRRFLVRTQIVIVVLVLVLDLLAADRLRGRARGRYRPFGSGCAGLGDGRALPSSGAACHNENCFRALCPEGLRSLPSINTSPRCKLIASRARGGEAARGGSAAGL